MRILLAGSEVHPYSKTGGLADMVAALAKFVGRAGHQVGVVTPLYADVVERFPDIRPFDWHLDLPLGHEIVRGAVRVLQPSENVTLYFIDHPPFYSRSGLYGEEGRDYPDNAPRFIFLSKAVAHLARYLPWQPEIVHVHDWQTGLVPLMIQHQRQLEGWNRAPRTVFTIHNLGYQGWFPAQAYELTGLPAEYFHLDGVECYGQLNCLKAGLAYADFLTTVSPTYAQEITTEARGERLDGLLRARQHALLGILNGVDYDEWNTTNNPHLPRSYSADDLAGKAANKAALQKELNLPLRPDVPLFGSVTRLAWQKGITVMLGALEEMIAHDIQFVLLGKGESPYEDLCRGFQSRYPDQVAVKIGFDTPLAHRIEAGSDFFLMPSLYEPSGLNQMYSLRYGTVPIVRATGGLQDSVIDAREHAERATGIKLHEFSEEAVAQAIRKALALYRVPPLLARFRAEGMRADFSWALTAERYLALFAQLLGRDGTPAPFAQRAARTRR